MVQTGERSVGLCFTLLWLFTYPNEMNAVKIEKIVVPEVIQYGVEQSVTLDCDYTLGNNTKGLVVKWFFGDDRKLVYQWIASNKPQVRGLLRNRVDLTYNVSDDPLKMHRALRIVDIDTDISGSYTCVVSTFMDEDEKTEEMIVFVPERNIRLLLNKTSDDTVTVTCTVDGVYPEPLIIISTPEQVLDVSHDVKLLKGRYTDTASVTLHDDDLHSPTKFICTMRISKPVYSVQEKAIYYPGPISRTHELPIAVYVPLHTSVGSTGKNFYVSLVLFSVFTQALVY